MGCSRGQGGAAHGKGERLTLRCLCRVVGLRQLGSCHMVRNGQFQGHSVCTLYTGVSVSGSMIFKVCFAFDVFWEIILLSPVNSLVLIESSDEYYCRQGVSGICPVFQGYLRKA